MAFEWNADNFPVDVNMKVREGMEEVHKQLMVELQKRMRKEVHKELMVELPKRMMKKVHKELVMMLMHGYCWWIRRYELCRIYHRDGNNDMWPPDKTPPHNMYLFKARPAAFFDKYRMLWISGVGEIHRGTLEEFQQAVDTRRWDRWIDGWEI